MRARATRSTYWVLILVQSSFSSWTPIRSRKSTAVRYHSPSRMSPYSTPLRVSFLVRTRYLTGLLSSSTAKSFALKVAPSYDTPRTGTPRLVPDIGVDVDGDLGFFLICVNSRLSTAWPPFEATREILYLHTAISPPDDQRRITMSNGRNWRDNDMHKLCKLPARLVANLNGGEEY